MPKRGSQKKKGPKEGSRNNEIRTVKFSETLKQPHGQKQAHLFSPT
jgi:hypothetical protein